MKKPVRQKNLSIEICNTMNYSFNMNIKFLYQTNDNFVPVYRLKPGDEFYIPGVGYREKSAYGKFIELSQEMNPILMGNPIIRYDAYLPNGRKIHPDRSIRVAVLPKELRKLRSL